MVDDKVILSEIKKAINRGGKGKVVNVDEIFRNKFDFQILRWEDILRGTNRTIPPNKWSFYRIGLLTKGSGEFRTGIYKYKAVKNTLVLIPSRVITSSKNWTPDTRGYVILFNINFFLQNRFSHKYFENKRIVSHSVQPYIHLTDNEAAEIETIFKAILKENQVKSKHREELIALKLLELLILSERLFEEKLHVGRSLPSINAIGKFLDLLEANFLQEHSVQFYAEKLSVHPNYLNSLIKKNTGLSAKESIQNRLMLESKYLLHSTNLTIKEISNQVGFNDPNYFSSFFTRLEKMSPVSYRTSVV